ncbi:MAG TPA: thiamine phosphate synthase, partial [Rhodanobacteraceae bacterium]|nr:thiamine phosphate synthase [Rhodanobacteraceae bacterium]
GPHADLLAACAAVLAGGATVLQYRDDGDDHARRLQEASVLAQLCAAHGAPLLIADDIALAAESGATGVHLGLDGNRVAEARHRLGPDAIIGVSCGNRLERAREMTAAGADYLSFGAFFPSPTLPHAALADIALLREAQSLRLPIVAIGGINADNGYPLIAAGAHSLAAISALFDSANPTAAARSLSRLFSGAPA